MIRAKRAMLALGALLVRQGGKRRCLPREKETTCPATVLLDLRELTAAAVENRPHPESLLQSSHGLPNPAFWEAAAHRLSR
jgi:hypothetical protein